MKEHKRYNIGILIGGVHTYFPKEHILGIAEAAEELDVNVCFFLGTQTKDFFEDIPQQFLRLKELAVNTVGVNNSIFDVELNSLLSLYKSLVKEIDTIKKEINQLIEEVHPHYMSVPGIGPLSAAVIYSEYGDISNFTNPGQMLAFAGIEPGINESGTESHGGKMVKRGSSQLRYTLINCCLPLIRFDMTFATYYAKKRGEGKPHRVAITHVAKKLIRVIYALESQDIDFNAQELR